MQKKIFNLNTFTIKSLLLLVGIILSGCLPLQKTTECADNEAFDPARRKCVPTLGASTTSTVFINNKVPENSYTTTTAGGAVTHSIAVSDAYSFGFSTRWVIHYSGSSIINDQVVATNTLSYSLNPSALFGVGNYVIEAIVYDEDGNDQIDSASWNVAITTLAPPTLTSPNPAGSSISYTSESTSETLSLSITNPDNQSGQYVFYLDGVSVDTGNFTSATNSLSDTINPSSMTPGIHTLELELNDGSGNVFDNYVWTIIITDPEYPAITDFVDQGSETIFSLVAINGIDMANNGYFAPDYDQVTRVCVNLDDFDKNDDGDSDVDYYFTISGLLIASGTFNSNSQCISTLTAQNLAFADIGESRTLTVKITKRGTSDVVDFREVSLTIRPTNIRPSISIDSSSTITASCSDTSSSSSYLGCTMDQSVNYNQDSVDTDYADIGDVNKSKTFMINIDDPDIDLDNTGTYQVYYQLKEVNDASFTDLDLSNAYSTSDCVRSLGEGADYNEKRTCTLNMDAFNANGPIAPGVYILKAFVYDNGSTWAPGDVKESNFVTWEITVSEYQTVPESIAILDLDTNAADGPGSDGTNPLSFIETANDACVGTGTLIHNTTPAAASEGDYIIVTTKVQDIERDHFDISLEMENNNVDPVGFSTVQALRTITRTTNDLTYSIESCFKIPEWTVVGTSQATVKIKVTVTDKPDEEGQQTVSKDFEISVNHVNPDPVFDDNADEARGHTVTAGYPYTITPPNFTDASNHDGVNVSWQWEVSVDNGSSFTAIPKANSDYMSSPTLVWTPDPNEDVVTDAQLRICLYDDGHDNDLSDCTVESKTYTNITIKPSVNQVQETTSNNSTGDSLASWFDEEDDDLYVAYAKGTKIYIEKVDITSTTYEFTNPPTSINFNTESPSKTSKQAFDISLYGKNDGTNKSLFVAYRLIDNDSGNPTYRIRRIYIDNNKMSFHYVGLYDSANEASDLIITDTNFNDHTTISDGAGIDETVITLTSTSDLVSDSATITFNFDTPVTLNFSSVCESTDSEIVCATKLASAINNLEGLTATPSGSSVTIKGYPRGGDYYDETAKVTPVIGKLIIDDDKWYLPFSDSSNDLKISVAHGSNLLDYTGSNWNTPAKTSLNDTSTFNQEITNTIYINKLLIAAKGSSGNINLYRFNDSTFAHEETYSNIFSDFSDINKISISSKDTDPKDIIWISAVLTTTAGEKNLAVAAFNQFNFTDKTITSDFSSLSHPLTSHIDNVSIQARTANGNEAIASIITSSDNTDYPNETHLLKLYVDENDISNGINLKSSVSPKFNLNTTCTNCAVASNSIISNFTQGNAGAGDENEKDALIFLWHEDSSSTNIIQYGVFNIEDETITSDEGIDGSYPANIAP